MIRTETIRNILAEYLACLDGLEADLAGAGAQASNPRLQQGLGELLALLQARRAAIENKGRLELEGLEARVQSGLRRFAELRERQEQVALRLAALAGSGGADNP